MSSSQHIFLLPASHSVGFKVYARGAEIPSASSSGRGNFSAVDPNIFSAIFANFYLKCQNLCQFTCTKQKAPHSRKKRRPLYSCGPSVWNLLHVTYLATRIWNDTYIFVNFVDPRPMLSSATFRHAFYLQRPSIFSSVYLYQSFQLFATIDRCCLKYTSTCAFTNRLYLVGVSRRTW